MKEVYSLQDFCLYCIKNNINNILISESEKLLSFDNALLTKLAQKFSNTEAEKIMEVHNEVSDDDDDRETEKCWLKSFIYQNLIVSLTIPEPETYRGHYWSLYDSYKCATCEKLISHKISGKIQCHNDKIMMNRSGEISFTHEVNTDWNLIEHMYKLRNNLRYSWRNIYWKLWSECHYLYCNNCNQYYSLYNYDKCNYHSDAPIFHSMDKNDDDNKSSSVGQYRCCGRKAYIYDCTNLPRGGCQTKRHEPCLKNNNATDMLRIFESHQFLILNDNRQSKIEFKTENNYEKVMMNSWKLFQTFPTNKVRYRKGLLGKLSDIQQKIQAQNVRRGQSEMKSWFVHQNHQYTNHDDIPFNSNDITLLTDSLSELKVSSKSSKPCNKKRKKVKSTGLLTNSEKLKTTDNSENDKLVMSMEAPQTHKINKNSVKNINGDEMPICNEGCCLPLQEINANENFFNKPIQYTKKAYKHKKTKCGLQSNQWNSTFSTRFNQDKQREKEENSFVCINAWLSERIDSFDALTDKKIVEDYLKNDFLLQSHIDDDNSIAKENDDVNENEDDEGYSICSSTNSFSSNSDMSHSSYCSTINSTIRVHHSRTTPVWNSFMPLAGTFVRIETDWRDAINRNLNSTDIQTSNTDNVNNNGSCQRISMSPVLSTFHNRLKAHCKYPYYKCVQPQLSNRLHSFKYKGQNMYTTIKRKTLEIQLNHYAEDYNRIWCYDRSSHELDYLSATFMPIPDYKHYRFVNCDSQNEWEDMINLDKSWNAFLKMFFENETLPKKNYEIQQNIQSFHDLYNLYKKIDSKRGETNMLNEINSSLETSRSFGDSGEYK